MHRTDLQDTVGNWERVGVTLETLAKAPLVDIYEGASPDFCHLFVSSAGNFRGEPNLEALLPEALNTRNQVYEVDRGCDGSQPALRLVAVNGVGKPISPLCKVDIGIQGYTATAGGSVPLSAYNAIAADGQVVFFTTCIGNETQHHQIFVRLGARKTLEVSKPLADAENCVEVASCKHAKERPSADFVGASEDGSRLFFLTKAQLVSEDSDNGNDLYMARVGCPEGESGCGVSEKVVTSLVQVSHDTNAGASAEVQGVLRVAPDGSRVYFVARGALSGSNRGGGAPTVGADNLYVYDGVSGEVTFIGDLCSGFGLSGLASDVHCQGQEEAATDAGLWSEGGSINRNKTNEAQTGGTDGRFLVFASGAQLTPDDTDSARDVYVYDAVADSLKRVSLGEEGYDRNGNNDAFNASIALGHRGTSVRLQYEMGSRAISDDGSKIVFSTAEPLSSHATNGLLNAYVWHANGEGAEGRVSLVSSGSSDAPDEQLVISPSGEDIFFKTVQGLLPQDTDGAPDIYDARVGGGFPAAPAVHEPCSAGDGCQGPLTNPLPLLVPATTVQAPGQNFAAPSPAVAKAKPKSKPARCRKGYVKKKGKCVKRSKAMKAGNNRRAKR